MNNDNDNTITSNPTSNNIAEIAKLVKAGFIPQNLTIANDKDQPPLRILILPKGDALVAESLEDKLDAIRTHPKYRHGTAHHTDIASLIQHTKRFANPHSVIFINDQAETPTLTTIFDYHDSGADGTPRHGKHRATMNLQYSEEWLAWKQACQESMGVVGFSGFLEDRIVEVIAPPDFTKPPEKDEADIRLYDMMQAVGGKPATPQRLMELARGLKIHENSVVKQAFNTSSGESAVMFETEHQDEQGKPLEIPNMFLIAIPVFTGGDLYRVPVRLRYRHRNGIINWHIKLYRTDLVEKDAFEGVKQALTKETGLPIFMGADELMGATG